jgi:hypothetical protein
VAAYPDQFPDVLSLASGAMVSVRRTPSTTIADAAGVDNRAADIAPESATAAAVRRRAEDIGCLQSLCAEMETR